MKLQKNEKSTLLMPFADPVNQSQQCYRKLLKAMSEPGTCFDMGDTTLFNENQEPVFSSSWAVLQTLVDNDCYIFLSSMMMTKMLSQSLTFYTDCRIADKPEQADFVLIDISEVADFSEFKMGSLEEPHLSATVIIQVPSIAEIELPLANTLTLTGPGIKNCRHLQVQGLHSRHVSLLQNNHQSYPCGLDFILCSPQSFCALPRTTIIENFMLKEEC